MARGGEKPNVEVWHLALHWTIISLCGGREKSSPPQGISGIGGSPIGGIPLIGGGGWLHKQTSVYYPDTVELAVEDGGWYGRLVRITTRVE
jgi:hypothetical protein